MTDQADPHEQPKLDNAATLIEPFELSIPQADLDDLAQRLERVRLSRRWAERRFANLVHFNELDRGGHFAALEQPALFVDEVKTTFRSPR